VIAVFGRVAPFATERKLRLLACGCYRIGGHRFKQEFYPPSVEVVERVADGLATREELLAMDNEARRATPDEDGEPGSWSLADPDPVEAARGTLWAYTRWGSGSWVWERKRRWAWWGMYARLVSDVLAPYITGPVPFSPAWRTSSAVALAGQIYDSRDFSEMPILADALEEAGCDSEQLLGHCRGSGPHVRGCWVVDQLLGKV
jgi:hypothetical protein